MPTSQPKLLDLARERIRVKYYKPAHGRGLSGRIKRFIPFHDKRHPKDMNAAEVEAFLSSGHPEEGAWACLRHGGQPVRLVRNPGWARIRTSPTPRNARA